jgi:hypothetical protein
MAEQPPQAPKNALLEAAERRLNTHYKQGSPQKYLWDEIFRFKRSGLTEGMINERVISGAALLEDPELTEEKVDSWLKVCKEGRCPEPKPSAPAMPVKTPASPSAEHHGTEASAYEQEKKMQLTEQFIKEVHEYWGDPDAVAEAAFYETLRQENYFGNDHDDQVSNARRTGVLAGLNANSTPEAFIELFRKLPHA